MTAQLALECTACKLRYVVSLDWPSPVRAGHESRSEALRLFLALEMRQKSGRPTVSQCERVQQVFGRASVDDMIAEFTRRRNRAWQRELRIAELLDVVTGRETSGQTDRDRTISELLAIQVER